MRLQIVFTLLYSLLVIFVLLNKLSQISYYLIGVFNRTQLVGHKPTVVIIHVITFAKTSLYQLTHKNDLETRQL